MKKNLIGFVIGLLIFGAGCGYVGFEILSFDYIDTSKNNVVFHKESYTYKLNGNIYEISSEYGEIEIVDSNNLIDSFILEISYPEDLMSIKKEEKIENNTNSIGIKYQENLNSEEVKDIFVSFLEDFKNRKFYNYQKTYTPKVIIYIKEENLNYLKVKNIKVEGFEL